MNDYRKLVEALRHCNGASFLTCRECQYNNNMSSCVYRMLQDSADAIEELQTKLGEQIELQTKEQGVLLDRIAELEQQLPKRSSRIRTDYQ